MTTPESKLLAEIREALGGEVDLVLWRNNTGALRDDTGRQVRYGLAVGSADLIGILAPSGRMFALEVKAPGGKLSIEQQRWIRLAESMGAFARVVRSVPEALKALSDARAKQRADVEDAQLLEAFAWSLRDDLEAARADVKTLHDFISETWGFA
jgi:hypothetical protein